MSLNPRSTVLITGGAGYIGSLLIRRLGADERFQELTVRVLDNLARGTFQSLAGLPRDGRFEFIEGDILDPVSVAVALEGVSTVVHLAALAKTPFSFDHPRWTEHVNHWGTANLLDRCVDAGVDRFVFASSASVYGAAGHFTEGSECQPVGPYSLSKYQAEHDVRSAGDRGLNWTILRLGTVHGDAPAVRFDAVPNRLAYLAAIGRPLTVHGEGDQVRPVVHAEDAAEAIIRCLDGGGSTVGALLNVVGENVTVAQMAEVVAGLRPMARKMNTAQDALTHFSLTVESERLRDALAWRPERTVYDGMAELLERFGNFRAPPRHELADEAAPEYAG